MTRSDTLRAIAAYCRASHAASLLAVGYVTLELSTEGLEGLLEALSEQEPVLGQLNHLLVLDDLMRERFETSSRLD